MQPFWYGWKSWKVELFSGLAVVALVALGPLLGGTLISIVYEAYFDKNGWSWLDVWQREVGIVVGSLAIHVLRAILG